MIKATANNGKLVLLGLSRANMEQLMLKHPIMVRGADIGGIPLDIVIMGGETEQTIMRDLEKHIDERTKLHISDKLKD